MRFAPVLLLVGLVACSSPATAPKVPTAPSTLRLKNLCTKSNAVAVVDTTGAGDPSNMVWMTPDTGISYNAVSKPVTMKAGTYVICIALPNLPNEMTVVLPIPPTWTLTTTCTDVTFN